MEDRAANPRVISWLPPTYIQILIAGSREERTARRAQGRRGQQGDKSRKEFRMCPPTRPMASHVSKRDRRS